MEKGCASSLTRSCATCVRRYPHRFEDRTALVAEHYEASVGPWIVGYSGGKDSSAVLKLVYEALLRVSRPSKPVVIAYCDTGVEIPLVRSHVLRVFRRLRAESRRDSLPIRIKV